MKDLTPEGWTWTPKPVSLSSHAIHGFSAGWRLSMARFAMVILTRATRFRKFGSFPEHGGSRRLCQHLPQHAEVVSRPLRGCAVLQSPR